MPCELNVNVCLMLYGQTDRPFVLVIKTVGIVIIVVV